MERVTIAVHVRMYFLFALNYADQNDYDRAMDIRGDRFYIQGVQTQGGVWDNAVTEVHWRSSCASGLISNSRISITTSEVMLSGKDSAADRVVHSRSTWTWFPFQPRRGNPSANLRTWSWIASAGYYRQLSGGCVTIDLRMMALFDTVLSTAVSNLGPRPFRMVIPEQVRFVSQAVAANEYRKSFPLESIEPSFAAISSGGHSPGTRIERAFVGAHADIGGGYNGIASGDGGDLSDVALNWMVQRADAAGVQMRSLPASCAR